MRVILVFFDTLRADHVGSYGYPKNTTPNVDRLAGRGARFLNCYPTNVPTQPCYTSVLTGRPGIDTGVVTHGQPESTISQETVTFPEILAEHGILTAAVSTLYRFRRWFAKGFTHYVQPDISTWLQHVTADQVNAQVLPWLRAYGNQDFFLFLHYWDPHTPYSRASADRVARFYDGEDPFDPRNRSLEGLRAQRLMYYFISGVAVPELEDGLTDARYVVAKYDAEIAYADDRFGQVLDLLEELEIMDDTMIIFTSDHGEALDGEHGVYFDHMDAYEQVSHVPLIIHRPGQIGARTIEPFVQHIDFAPTILEAFGIRVPHQFTGRSLWPLLRGESTSHYSTVFTDHGLWSAQRAMRTKRWSLMKTIAPGMLRSRPSLELFDRVVDRDEEQNVASAHPGVVAALNATYYARLEEQLGDRPDPLRLAAEKSSAFKRVKARFDQRLPASGRKSEAITPEDRADIDNQPAAESTHAVR
jgi:arylsulfatase A-like enzyme